MKESGSSLAELAAPMPKYPQVLENVKVARRIDPTKSPQIQEAVAKAEGRLGSSGRIVLRPSGTEPVIRVMVEGSDDKLVREIARELAASVAFGRESRGLRRRHSREGGNPDGVALACAGTTELRRPALRCNRIPHRR